MILNIGLAKGDLGRFAGCGGKRKLIGNFFERFPQFVRIATKAYERFGGFRQELAGPCPSCKVFSHGHGLIVWLVRAEISERVQANGVSAAQECADGIAFACGAKNVE